jgi:hypothetical protein
MALVVWIQAGGLELRAGVGRRGGSVYFIIHWIELRGIGTYDIGWVCV